MTLPAPASHEALIAEGLRFPEGATRCADIQLQIMADAVLIYRLATALQSAERERGEALEDFVRTSDLADEFCDEAATWKARAETAEVAQQRAEGLFDAISHGDTVHRAWLKQAIEDHFAGRPVSRAALPKEAS